MSRKKGKKRVLNRKFKRTVRYTMAAMCMVTAITVAAIPAQENAAAGSMTRDALPERGDTSYSYEVKDDRTNPMISGAAQEHDSQSGDGTYFKSVNNAKLANYHRNNSISTMLAYKVLDIGNDTYSLNWQYRYYDDGEGYVVCDYNDGFKVDTIEVGSTLPTKYETITVEEFEKYFKEAAPVELTAEAYLANDGKNVNTIALLEKYATSSFATWKKGCDDYYADHEAWRALADKTGRAEPQLKDYAAATFVLDLKEMNSELQKQYYCQYVLTVGDFTNPGKFNGFTLKLCDDYSSGTIKEVYLVQALDREKVDSDLINKLDDDFAFLCSEKTTRYIHAIGDYAFAGVTNVKELKLTGQISGIGDYAFAGNTMLEKVTFGNLKIIGNAAFKNTNLKNVDLEGVEVIGAEAFADNLGLETVRFSTVTTQIGAGAFKGCTLLKDVDLSITSRDFTIGDYAFYDCVSLSTIGLPDGIAKQNLKSIGKGTFAVGNGDLSAIECVRLPANLQKIEPFMFAGRVSLKSVVFPRALTSPIPVTMFVGCSGLEYVEFTDNCYDAEYEDDYYTFYDVRTDKFEVRGPGYKADGETIASPRKGTWTQIRVNHDFVPYVFTDKGTEYYETKKDGFILTVDRNNDVLTSCMPAPSTGVDKKLTIPSYVGDIKLSGIQAGCITKEIKNVVEELVIEDNSISAIDASAFEECPKLRTVEIGNSVDSIGANAFAKCPELVEVTFNTPLVGYEQFNIGPGAFTTGSKQLTFHGDIEAGYAPFDWAVDPGNYINESTGVRVCYESLSPTYLKVIYDGNQDAVTLIDYPKYKNIDIDHAEDNKRREQEYYTAYSGAENDASRDAFRESWIAFVTEKGGAFSKDEEEAFYAGMDEDGIYGPWVNEEYASEKNTVQVPNAADATQMDDVCVWEVEINGAKSNYVPKPYFDFYHYSILNNRENPDYLRDWKRDLNKNEQDWIDACLNINVPKAVTSIDVKKFLDDEKKVNNSNKSLYLDMSSEDYRMYSGSGQTASGNGADSGDSIIGGLFSGYYKDSTDDRKCPAETVEKGNDYVTSIVLEGVTSLPDYAFDNCENLRTVSLGPDCKTINTAPFRGCTSLTSVGGNDVFFSENGIFYEKIGNEALKIKECLASRGHQDGVGGQVVQLKEDPRIAYVTEIEAGAFQDCDEITGVDLSSAASAVDGILKQIPDDAFRNCDILSNVILPDTVDSIQDHAFAEVSPLTVKIPGREVFISTTAFDHKSNVVLRSYPGSAAEEYANYYKPMGYDNIDDSYRVVFLDHDGKQIGEVQYVEEGKNATPPADPTWEGHTFTGWSGEYIGITADTILVAQYDTLSGSGGDSGSGSGSSGANGSGSGTSGSGSGANGSGSGSGSGSNSGKYVLTVIGGSGSGSYAAGTSVIISANNPPKGKAFYNWTLSPSTMSIISSRSAATTITMPASDATVTANYIDSGSNYLTVSTNEVQPLKRPASANATPTSNPTNSADKNRNDGDGTKVSITKPGISNRDLASATVNGSTDNFIVKITDSALATEEVQKALMAKYGSLDAIRYVAMDISLYDATGTTKIENTAGLSIDITIPLPDDLIPYAGNNKTAAVLNGQLEELSPKFTTIDGVACVTFRATHFSPYTIYADTNNLSGGGLDDTPKTGDPIAPKWFFSIGLAAVSILLFMKKDKPVRKVKAV